MTTEELQKTAAVQTETHRVSVNFDRAGGSIVC